MAERCTVSHHLLIDVNIYQAREGSWNSVALVMMGYFLGVSEIISFRKPTDINFIRAMLLSLVGKGNLGVRSRVGCLDLVRKSQ